MTEIVSKIILNTTDKTIKDLAPEERKTLLDSLQEVVDQIEAIKKEAKTLLSDNPGSIPGWTVTSSCRTTIANTLQCRTLMQKYYDISDKEFIKLSSTSLAKLEGWIAAKYSATTKEAKDILSAKRREDIQPCLNVSSAVLSLVKLDKSKKK